MAIVVAGEVVIATTNCACATARGWRCFGLIHRTSYFCPAVRRLALPWLDLTWLDLTCLALPCLTLLYLDLAWLDLICLCMPCLASPYSASTLLTIGKGGCRSERKNCRCERMPWGTGRRRQEGLPRTLKEFARK